MLLFIAAVIYSLGGHLLCGFYVHACGRGRSFNWEAEYDLTEGEPENGRYLWLAAFGFVIGMILALSQ